MDVDTLKLVGHSYVVPYVLDLDESGRPLMLAGARGGVGKNAAWFNWADTAWTVKWKSGYGTGHIPPVPSTDGNRYLVWKGVDIIGKEDGYEKSAFVFAGVNDRGIGRIDTLARVNAFTGFAFSGAASREMRWAAIDDYPDRLRLFVWRRGLWREIPVDGVGDYGTAITPLDDTTAVLVWMGLGEQMKWRLIRGDSLEEDHEFAPGVRQTPVSPRFRGRPSGGDWLAWGTKEQHVAISAFHGGQWTQPESIRCDHPAPDYLSEAVDVSRDDREYPAIAWTDFSTRTGVEVICVCLSTDSGFAPGQPLANSDGGLQPTVTRDRNDDVWVAWWRYYEGAFWTHTYTTAVVPESEVDGDVPTLTWRLSEPAPGTWWAVLRSSNGSEYTEMARVRAGPDSSMSWQDSSVTVADTVLRYRVRRECVDKRFERLSEPVVWRPKASSRALRLRLDPPAPNPMREAAAIRFELSRASIIQAEIFDVSGHLVRRLLRNSLQSAGTHTIEWKGVDSTGQSVSSGLYFVRIKSGANSVAALLAIS